MREIVVFFLFFISFPVYSSFIYIQGVSSSLAYHSSWNSAFSAAQSIRDNGFGTGSYTCDSFTYIDDSGPSGYDHYYHLNCYNNSNINTFFNVYIDSSALNCSGSFDLSSGACSVSCNVGDQKTYFQQLKPPNGVLTINVGEQPKSIIDGCEYTCQPTDIEFVMDDGAIMQECNGVSTGNTSTLPNSSGIIDASSGTPSNATPISPSSPGCIRGSGGDEICFQDNADCGTVNGVNICAGSNHKPDCVDVDIGGGQMREICAGGEKNCGFVNGKYLCATQQVSTLDINCFNNTTAGKSCVTTDSKAVKVKQETSMQTNPDGSVTETTTITDNVLCPAVPGKVRSISSNSNFFMDGTLVQRDSYGRILNQYICNDSKIIKKTTNSDGSKLVETSGKLDNEALSRKGINNGNPESSNNTDMTGVESRLDTANSHLESIKNSLDANGDTSGIQSSIDSALSGIDSSRNDYLTGVTDYFSNFTNPFENIADSTDFLPNLFPTSSFCNYSLNQTINVPFTNKQVAFNLDPCDKFAPFRELLSWVLYVFTIFQLIQIAFNVNSGG
jgi:hypothetical protein